MAAKDMKQVTLALQGGGAHGAFTWGVLEGLLDDGRIRIEGISGTSAGAMNGAVLTHGLEKDGPEGAKSALESFWSCISSYGSFSPYHSGPFNPLGADWSPSAIWFDFIAQIYSPYQLNPLNMNPLRNVLEDSIDFDFLRRCHKVKLYISATNVRNNHLHIFTNKDMCVDVLLASACLPTMHQAVQVGEDYYWDGGFMGNPVLEPLVRQCHTSDTLVVQINPTHREQIPVTAHAIADRMNEITFNRQPDARDTLLRRCHPVDRQGSRTGPPGTAGLLPPHCSRGRNGPFGAPEQAGHQLELFDAVAGYRERKDPELAAGELPTPGQEIHDRPRHLVAGGV